MELLTIKIYIIRTVSCGIGKAFLGDLLKINIRRGCNLRCFRPHVFHNLSSPLPQTACLSEFRGNARPHTYVRLSLITRNPCQVKSVASQFKIGTLSAIRETYVILLRRTYAALT